MLYFEQLTLRRGAKLLFEHASFTIAHVAQETPALPVAAIRYIMQGDAELTDLEVQLADAETRADSEALASLHERMATIDGYAAPARVPA